VDLMSLDINMGKWNALPKHLQQLVEAVVKEHSWDHYTAIQKADIEAFELFKKQGVEVIRLSEEDIEKFKRFAPPLWVQWAKKHPLALKAFKSQWEYIKSVKMGYFTEDDFVDLDGKKLTL
jgi:TRAP-type C4-dicarboxylate transport system substrate-binding protein